MYKTTGKPVRFLLELLYVKRREVEKQITEVEKLLSEPITSELEEAYKLILELLEKTLIDINEAEEFLKRLG